MIVGSNPTTLATLYIYMSPERTQAPMPLETATYIHQLNPANPSGSDKVKDGDDHLRLLKSTLRATFPGITGPLDPSITPAYLLALAGSGVPFGSMVPTIAVVAPAGWAICNGQTVAKSDGSGPITVPDLRGKVIMGLPIGGTSGADLGGTNKTVTSAAAGAHSHNLTITGGDHTHTSPAGNTLGSASNVELSIGQSPVGSGSGGGNRLTTAFTTDLGHSHAFPAGNTGSASHTHAGTADAVAAHAHSVTVDVTQPSMTFNIIIKI